MVSTKKAGIHDGGPLHFDLRIFSFDGTVELASLGDTALSANDSTRHITWDFDLTSINGFTVRLYGWAAENASGALSVDNFALNGSIAPVPEPVNAALGWFAASGLVVTMGRRALQARKR